MSEILAKYSFLPWLQQGMSLSVSNLDNSTDTTEERAELQVVLNVNRYQNGSPVSAAISKTAKLIGPGDVLGIQTNSIVRFEPVTGSKDFEPNYLPFIEFYDEDFLWRYTPAKADTALPADGERLRPWLTLVVLKENEFTYEKNVGGVLPYINMSAATADVFPDPNTLWAWAHVHVNDDVEGGNPSASDADVKARVNLRMNQNPSTVICRLMGARALEENTTYHCFVIPTFETGRRTGLGLDMDFDGNIPRAVEVGWETAGHTQFPVYYNWQFSTTDKGDFEYLVELLEPRPMDEEVGVRKMDIREPGPGMSEMYNVSGGYTTDYIGMGGALKTDYTKDYGWDSTDDESNFVDHLRGKHPQPGSQIQSSSLLVWWSG